MPSSSRTNSNPPPLVRHFFKVMMPGFRNRLSIPLAFCKHLSGEKSKDAVLTSRKGSWHVKIGKCSEGQLYFEAGWSRFVQEHDLNIGEFVVFEHKGNLHFEVIVYDYSACEKEFPVDWVDEEKRARAGAPAHAEENRPKRPRHVEPKAPSLADSG